MTDTKNPLAELAELLPAPVDEVEAHNKDALFYQLRFGETEIPDGIHSVTVTLKRAWLALDLAGLVVRLGTSYGTIAKPNTVVTKTMSEQTTELSVSASVDASVSKSLLSKLTLGAAGKKHNTSKSSTATETQQNRVTARSANRWEIAEPSGLSLDGDYLQHDTVLCRVKPSDEKVNRRAVTANIFARQRDFKFSNRMALSPMRERLKGILLAKALNGKATTSTYQGFVHLSEVTTTHED